MHPDKTDWVTAIGSVLAVVLSFMNSNAAALGVIIGLIGLWVQWHWKKKNFMRRQDEDDE